MEQLAEITATVSQESVCASQIGLDFNVIQQVSDMQLSRISPFIHVSIIVVEEVIITGFGEDNSKMEVLQTLDAKTNLCHASSYDYPLDVGVSSGALVDNQIIICGGDISATETDSCFKFGKDQNWKRFGKMSRPRSASASVALPDGIWVTGGSEQDEILKTTEVIYLNGTTVPGPQLPEPRYTHCLVKYKDTIFSIGGFYNGLPTTSVWIFSARNQIRQIGNGPNLKYARNLHACGIFNSNEHGGRPVLVVAGSGNFGPDGPRSSRTTEYWDFSIPGNKWELSSEYLVNMQKYL